MAPAACPVGLGKGRGVEIQHLPAPGGPAQRLAVVHLAGVGGDQVAGEGLDAALPAGRRSCALAGRADAEGGMRMARKCRPLSICVAWMPGQGEAVTVARCGVGMALLYPSSRSSETAV